MYNWSFLFVVLHKPTLLPSTFKQFSPSKIIIQARQEYQNNRYINSKIRSIGSNPLKLIYVLTTYGYIQSKCVRFLNVLLAEEHIHAKTVNMLPFLRFLLDAKKFTWDKKQ